MKNVPKLSDYIYVDCESVCMSTVTAPLNLGQECSCDDCNSIGYLQTMLLDSSLHLPPPALVIPSPSDVLLVETVLE